MKFFILLIYSLFSSSLAYAGSKTTVITSFSIIQDIVKNIAGDKIEVLSIVSNNQDVHDYELKPSDINKINHSKIFFINGLGLEGGFINHPYSYLKLD